MSNSSFYVQLRDDRYRLCFSQGALVKEVDDFLSALEARGLSPQTVRSYAFDLLVLYRFLKARPKDKERRVHKLSQSDLLDFIRFHRRMNAAPTSINRRLVVAGLLFRFLTGKHIAAAKDAEKGVSLPAPHYKGRGRDRDLGLHRIRAPRYRALRVKTPRTIIEPLTSEQARMLLRSFTKYRDLAIVYLMLLCGLRSREIIALKVNDVDFEDKRLRVCGKGNKERVLPLPSILLGVLRDYLRLERPSLCRKNALFVVLKGNHRGRAMTPSGLRSLFRHRRLNEKINNANPHRLRHTFGADMARAGVRLPILQRMMGHEDSKMTLRYINLSISDIAAEFQRAAEEIHKRYKEDK